MVEGFVFFLALLLTYAIKHIALKKKLLDIPNERSSHSVPTPRGGGLAIMVAIFIGAMITSKISLILPVLLIVLVSFLDDIAPISAKKRFIVQMVCALFALYAMGGVNSINFGIFEIHGSWLNIFAFLFIVWMTNLYNFLDGIDGYAGSEAVFVGLASFMLFDVHLGLIIAFASLGFLCFNWHKASIFMGDVGSAPLGFLFASLALTQAHTPYFLGWIVLLCLFWFDATMTLFKRLKNGESLSTAHKKHLYQRIHQSGWAHDKIVMAGMGLNLAFFVMLSFLNAKYYIVALLVAIFVLWRVSQFVDKKKVFS